MKEDTNTDFNPLMSVKEYGHGTEHGDDGRGVGLKASKRT